MALEENKKLVEQFYSRLWNKWDLAAIDELLSTDISFRGSLGHTKSGHAGFTEYVELIKVCFPGLSQHG